MVTVCIIGAGQLGSRHLQGIHRSDANLDIWVVDPSTESLEIAKNRYNQIESNSKHKIHFENTMDKLPRAIDLCIIATSSKPRYKILADLLKSHKVKNIILEKFLFPSLEEYELASDLIKENDVVAYVNCPYRLYDSYAYIDSIIDKSQPLEIKVTGTDWGLCCNAIHYIDIFMKLCGESSFEVDTEMLIPRIRESKRKGYIEFNGTLKIKTKRGNSLTLTSLLPEEVTKTCIVSINNGEKRIEIDEAEGLLKHDTKVLSFPIPYQSELTGRYVETLINGSELSLSKYEESKEYHKTLLSKLIEFYNSIAEEKVISLPIT